MCRPADDVDTDGPARGPRRTQHPSASHPRSGRSARSHRRWPWLSRHRQDLAVAARHLDVLGIGPDDEGLRDSVQMGMGGNRQRGRALATDMATDALTSQCNAPAARVARPQAPDRGVRPTKVTTAISPSNAIVVLYWSMPARSG